MLNVSDRAEEGDAATRFDSGERPIDLVHLSRMTFGDRSLEREVLQLFERQTVEFVGRMRRTAPAEVGTLAHTLKGSARGVGAWQIARAAEALESVVGDGEPAQLAAAIDRLARAAEDVRAMLAELLAAG